MTIPRPKKELATSDHYKQVTLFIVGGSKLSRQCLRQVVEAEEFTEIHTFEEIRAADGTIAPDLILVDLIPDRVLEDLEESARVFSNVPIVVLSDNLSTAMFTACVRTGIHGYLLKDISTESLCAALRLVLLGGKVFPTDLLASLVCDVPDTHDRQRAFMMHNRLTRRELQILSCLVQGDSNKLIARRLETTEATVKVQMKTLVRKIGVQNRTQAAVWVIANGLMKAPPMGLQHRRSHVRPIVPGDDIPAPLPRPEPRVLAGKSFGGSRRVRSLRFADQRRGDPRTDTGSRAAAAIYSMHEKRPLASS